AACPERIEQRLSRREHRMRRAPDVVLGVDERIGLLDAELAQDVGIAAVAVLAVEHRLAPPGRERRVIASETGPVPDLDEVVVPLENDEVVVPGEEHRLDHAAAKVAGWRAGSCGEASSSHLWRSSPDSSSTSTR